MIEILHKMIENDRNVPQNDQNPELSFALLVMSIILGVAAVIGLFLWIEHHSSFYVVLGSIVILMMAGILMFVVIMLYSGRSSDD